MATPSDFSLVDSGAVLTVYYEGTANPIDVPVTQLHIFFRRTNGKELTTHDHANNGTRIVQWASKEGVSEFKVGYSGCGHEYGMTGMVFARGLSTQVAETVRFVDRLLSIFKGVVTVNAVGLSRGGIAVMMLARALAGHDRERVALNALLFDPVPGNLIGVARWLDPLGVNTANAHSDLTKCHTLRSVLGIYPYEPLPAIAFHAPVVPTFPPPSSCEVTLDVVLGCHQGALLAHAEPDMRLSFVRIKSWLVKHGTSLSSVKNYEVETATEKECIAIMDRELKADPAPCVRHGHYSRKGSLKIVRREKGQWLNRYHEELHGLVHGDVSLPGRSAGAGVPKYMLDFTGLKDKRLMGDMGEA